MLRNVNNKEKYWTALYYVLYIYIYINKNCLFTRYKKVCAVDCIYI